MEVSCPLHNRRVKLKTGETKDDPLCRVPAFPVEVRDGTVYVDASALQGSLV
jgi:nitrite reductase/ring-hydroxylating ferredoxin subunit